MLKPGQSWANKDSLSPHLRLKEMLKRKEKTKINDEATNRAWQVGADTASPRRVEGV